MNLSERQRRMALEGAVNFRDLGGYTVGTGLQTVWGRMFRSDSLADLTTADLGVLGALGLHTLIDFRLPMERKRKPNRLPGNTGLKTVEIGFLPEGMLEMMRRVFLGTLDAAGVEREMLMHYRRLPAAHTREYTEMFNHIERAGGQPVLIHCTSGKDRTGFGAAMILLALGATRQTVLQDYALTNQYRRDVSFLFSVSTPPAVIDILTSAPPKYLEAALAAIDRDFGSVDGYLERELRMTPERRERLRGWLTESAP